MAGGHVVSLRRQCEMACCDATQDRRGAGCGPSARSDGIKTAVALNCPISLRPRDGDMGVLFEVFARHVYRVMPEVLPLEAVRTIVDVGAHAGFASIYLLRAIRMCVSTASSRTSGGVIRLGLRATARDFLRKPLMAGIFQHRHSV